jgi:hypothetical protein
MSEQLTKQFIEASEMLFPPTLFKALKAHVNFGVIIEKHWAKFALTFVIKLFRAILLPWNGKLREQTGTKLIMKASVSSKLRAIKSLDFSLILTRAN